MIRDGREYNNQGHLITWEIDYDAYKDRWKREVVQMKVLLATKDEAQAKMDELMVSGLLKKAVLFRLKSKEDYLIERRRVATVQYNKRGEMTEFDRND
jgi:hypothetical protein